MKLHILVIQYDYGILYNMSAYRGFGNISRTRFLLKSNIMTKKYILKKTQRKFRDQKHMIKKNQS